jgi:L-tartrate/succinate antiporter
MFASVLEDRTGAAYRAASDSPHGARTLGLGYAVTAADCSAPVTPSATARSGGTIYPVVRSIPELYGRFPRSVRQEGGANCSITALAASMVTSSCSSRRWRRTRWRSRSSRGRRRDDSWVTWFQGFLPVGIVLLLCSRAPVRDLSAGGQTRAEAPRWAASQLEANGADGAARDHDAPPRARALGFWIEAPASSTGDRRGVRHPGDGDFRVVTWDEIVGHSRRGNTLIWFATLVTMAAGWRRRSSSTGCRVAVPMLPVWAFTATICRSRAVFFLPPLFLREHHRAHRDAVSPVLAVAIKIPVVTPVAWALLLAYPLGMIGVLTPYASGQNAVYYGSGYIKPRDIWVLGFTLGVTYLTGYLAIIVKWLEYLGV